jgi:hypothetical protein
MWKCLACCAHQRLLFQHIHKFLLRKDVRPRKRSFFQCLACCGHQRLLFQHIHKFLLRKDVRPRKPSLFHCPPPACHSCLPILVSGANLIFTNNCLVFQTCPIRRTAGSGYIKTLKELPGFKEEPVVIWLIQIVFVDHELYIKNGYLIFLRIVIMNLKKLPWYPAGVCAVYNTRPTMVYIPSES